SHLLFFMPFKSEDRHVVSRFSLDGRGGGVTVYGQQGFGVTGEFNGYASTTKTFRFPATANSPCPAGCTVTGSGDMFSYNVGPVLKYRGERWEPFVEVLFGGVHSNTYNNLFKACQANCTTTLTPS